VRLEVTILVLVLLVTVCGRAVARDDKPADCARYSKIPFPTADRPTAAEKKALAKCSSEDLYYGIGTPVDAVKARKCAYVEMDSGQSPEIGGEAMLMTIYANGQGAARNLPLALRLACAVEIAAPAEMEGRVEDLLERLKKPTAKRKPFHYCDAATSGYLTGFCTAHDEKKTRLARDKKLAKLVATWPAPQRAALRKLEAAAAAFFGTRVNNEVDLTGTMRASLMEQEQVALEKGFLSAIQRLENGALPRASAAQFKATERQLNEVYSRIMKDPTFAYGTVTRDQIRKTERLWLPYREAWVALGAQRYPTVTPESWRTWIAKQRIAMLKDLIP
jgi:hypothetical protein